MSSNTNTNNNDKRKTFLMQVSASDSDFLEIIEKGYNAAKKKADANRDKNMLWKKIYIFTLVLTILAGATFYFLTNDGIKALVLVTAGFLLASCIKKWIDVKKYQETWARHRAAAESMELEVIRYLYDLEPYQKYMCKERKLRCLQERMVALSQKNIDEFAQNISEKEITLTDFLEKISINMKK